MWFRVNEQLPANLQKSLPDRPPEMKSADIHEGEDIKGVLATKTHFSFYMNY